MERISEKTLKKNPKKTTPTEQTNILYLERLEFPLFVQMVKRSDALLVLLDKKQEPHLSYIKIYKY